MNAAALVLTILAILALAAGNALAFVVLQGRLRALEAQLARTQSDVLGLYAQRRPFIAPARPARGVRS